MSNKLNNNKKFPTANKQPRHKAAERKLQAEVRQSVYNELSLQRKIDQLAPEPVAAKQRKKLLAKLEKQKSNKLEVKTDSPNEQ